MEDNIKQVIVMRKDLNMRKGKMCAQASHASMMFLVEELKRNKRTNNPYIDNVFFSNRQEDWLFNGKFTKVVLGVDSEEELLRVHQAAREAGLRSYIIEDEGRTEFHGVKTKTCIAIGPDYAFNIDPVTRELRCL